MAHYEDRGLIGDYREYETHASRLVELFPKKHGAHPPVLHEARENLRLLMKSIGNNIERMSWSPSRETSRNQKSVFDWDWEEESRSRANSAPLNSHALSALEENTDIAAVSSPQCDGSNDGNEKEVTGGIGDQLHTRDSGAYIRAEVSDQNLVISQARDQIIPTEYSVVKHQLEATITTESQYVSDRVFSAEQRSTLNTRTLSLSEIEDSKTSYSDTFTLEGSTKEVYVDELVRELLKALSSFRIDSPSLRRVADAMPECLKAFSLRLESAESSQQVHRDVTAFIRKYRQ